MSSIAALRALTPMLRAVASSCYPSECCGWIAGDRLYAAINNSTMSDGYEFAAASLLTFYRAFEQAMPPTVIYHSHPHGAMELSAIDLVALAGTDLQTQGLAQLVIAGEPRLWQLALWKLQGSTYSCVAQWQ